MSVVAVGGVRVPAPVPCQQCANCRHFVRGPERPEDVTVRGRGECMVRPDGEPVRLPVFGISGTDCGYWRRR